MGRGPGDGPEPDLQGLLLGLASLPLNSEPGTGWRYSVALDVAGGLLERLTKKRFDTVLSEQLFKPLGMNSTGFSIGDGQLSRLSSNYAWIKPDLTLLDKPVLIDGPGRSDWLGPQKLLAGGAGLLSSARDYARFGQMLLDSLVLLRRPARGPWREISASVYRTGTQALGITAAVGCLIGVTLSYLSSEQLRTFGADAFIVNILGIGIVRELGPMICAVLVAGRSGSAITAQLGVMRVTEELDALAVMGIPYTVRLILPKVIALAIAMPLLILWTSSVALIGGAFSAKLQLGMNMSQFITSLPGAVPTINVWLGVGKGVVFGILIALVACHFGMRIQPNTESLGIGTTRSVVTAITVVILADAVFAVLFADVGISLT